MIEVGISPNEKNKNNFYSSYFTKLLIFIALVLWGISSVTEFKIVIGEVGDVLDFQKNISSFLRLLLKPTLIVLILMVVSIALQKKFTSGFIHFLFWIFRIKKLYFVSPFLKGVFEVLFFFLDVVLFLLLLKLSIIFFEDLLGILLLVEEVSFFEEISFYLVSIMSISAVMVFCLLLAVFLIKRFSFLLSNKSE